MNGLNEPNLNMYERLLSSHQLVSHTTSTVFDERRGVVLLLSSSSPFGEVEDLTADVYTEQLRNRYLLLKTCLGDQAVFIHVVYAPDEPSPREEFFHSLPFNFDHTRSDRTSQDEDSFHIVLGDFNVTLDSYLDQATPSHHLPAQGRPALRNWLDALGLIDAWRFQHPDVRECTSPTRKNRLDYCFLTVPLIRDHLATINHVRDREWRCEDHTPVEFTLHAKNLPRLKKAPWSCPTWLLQVPDVREYLVRSAHALADRIKIFPGTNPGCLLDEHKRSDSIYLRRKWIELREVDSRCISAKITAVNEALDLCNASPTQENLTKCEQARAELAAYCDTIKQRNEAKKFAADLHLSERATRYFFRAPQQDSLRSPIT
ncbi:hypothetical protein PsorP6_014954 [Peronosclerospora sorghi]|uniref:Uncharacterized protein n=1 Tax=Peronosclerospora sorghi TaxID=230839 RepID=A0ACC0VSL4_9STRA|nr:hypothetical protein PsorP6_014954 [Peronosclerospora sorghi]